MAIHVLGPVDADGKQLSPRERTVLAALAVSIPYGASAATLADALWGDDLPSTWPKQLQAIIGLIRRSIGVQAIATTPTGYALTTDADSLDAARFERLVAAARSHAAADDPERAADSYRRALGLWRGSAYAELADWKPAGAEISRLRAIREAAEEELLAVRLACGEQHAAISDAERLVRESPYREERWCLLAVANYQSGRQAEALSALRAARRKLDDDLGIEPGERLTDLETAILRHDPSLAPAHHEPRISDACPYRGLNAYGPDDADVFFGRDAEIELVVERLTRQGFLALAGASGSGKSSLALAGAVPVLTSRGWAVEIVHPDLEARATLTADEERVVVVDQFEEIFAAGLSEVELEAFGDLLESFVHGGGCVLLTVRSDFLDRCAAIPALARLIAEGVYVLGPPAKDALRLAIEGPAGRAGLRLEPGLTELVLRDAQGATAALPLLSYALAETWLRREGSVLTVEGYEASGGISGAIAQSAEDLYATLSPDEKAICRSTMLRLISRGPDGSAVARRAASGPLIEDRDRREVLARLTRARLITAQDDSIAVSHEAIASAWPRLGEWLDEDAEVLRISQGLTAAVEQWADAGRTESDLYRGARLAAVEEWAGNTKPRLTADEKAFVDASGRAADAERHAAAERAAQVRRTNRRLRLALASAAVLLVGSLTATGVAISGSAAARSAQTDASIEALLGTSLALRSSSRDVSALLAAEMWKRWPDDPRSRAALMGVFTASGGILATTYLKGPSIVGQSITGAVIPGTNSMLTSNGGSMLDRRDVATGAVSASYNTHEFISRILVSGDGSRAMVLESRSPSVQVSLVEVFDTRTLRPVRSRLPLQDGPIEVAVSADGTQIAGVYSGTMQLFDITVDSGAVVRFRNLPPKPSPTAYIGGPVSLSFTPDGMIAVGSVAPEVQVFDPFAPSAPTARIPIPAYSANAHSTVTKDGLLIACGDESLVAVDLAARRTVWTHVFDSGVPPSCGGIAGSSATGMGYFADSSGTAVEFALTSGDPTGRTFQSQLGWPGGLSLSDDGVTLIIVGGYAPTMSVFRTDGVGGVTELVAPGQIMIGGYDSAGDAVVVRRATPGVPFLEDINGFDVWSAKSNRSLFTAPADVTFSGWGGDHVVTGFKAHDGIVGSLMSWDVATGSVLSQVQGSVPGRTVAGANGRVYWNIQDGIVATFDGSTQKRIKPTFPAGGVGATVSSNRDGSLVAITRMEAMKGDEWTTGLFDGKTGRRIIDGLTGPTVTAITPDGTQLIGAEGGRIIRYSLSTMKPIGTIPAARGQIDSLQMDRTGTTLLVTSQDGTVSLYDLATGRRLGDPIPGSSGMWSGGWLRPDGRAFAVNVANGVQIWDAVPEDQFTAACRIAGRELTDAEWTTYLSWLPTRDNPCAAVLR